MENIGFQFIRNPNKSVLKVLQKFNVQNNEIINGKEKMNELK
jgi:hypothetical protein